MAKNMWTHTLGFVFIVWPLSSSWGTADWYHHTIWKECDSNTSIRTWISEFAVKKNNNNMKFPNWHTSCTKCHFACHARVDWHLHEPIYIIISLETSAEPNQTYRRGGGAGQPCCRFRKISLQAVSKNHLQSCKSKEWRLCISLWPCPEWDVPQLHSEYLKCSDV